MTCTQAKVPKQTVYQAYNNFSSWRKDYLFNIKEPYIQKAMQRTFWQKILGKPARTREEAIDWCNANLIWTDYADCGLHNWREHQALKDLAALCDLTTDEFISVSSDDAMYIKRNLGE